MKQASLLAAAVLVLLANAVALINAARNRSGQPDAQIVLTERELTYYPDPDDSGIALGLTWVDPGAMFYFASAPDSEARIWLNEPKLAELGFDCGMAPSDPNASAFYSRQTPRTGFVALEYDGPAWRGWVDWRERVAQTEANRTGQKSTVDDVRRSSSRLVAIDAARDPAGLRSRHTDRNRILILPAVIRIGWMQAWPAVGDRPARPTSVTGYVQEIPSVIHVPKPFSDKIRALHEKGSPGYRVDLRFGSFFEPWVVGVEGP